MRTLDDVKCWFSQPYIGSAETAAAPYWRLVQKYVPGCRVLVVRRPVSEVVESVAKQGIAGIELPRLQRQLIYMNNKLNQVEARLPNTISVSFDELRQYEVCEIVFEHCTGMYLDPKWWEYWNKVNVQAEFDAVTRYVWFHAEPIQRLMKLAQQDMLGGLREKLSVDSPRYRNGSDNAGIAAAT